jgi:MFS family permease
MEANTRTNKSNPWVILLVLSLPLFIGSLDLTIISAILPELFRDFDLSPTSQFDDASWAIGGYLLAYTISMTFTGRLSDYWGRRSLYIICMFIFMFGSWLVTIVHLHTDIYADVFRWIYPDGRTHPLPSKSDMQLNLIIFARVIQALGAGAMVPVTMALVSDMFPADRRARPLGVVAAIDTAGWVLGHLYGGAMVKFFGTNGQDIVDAFASVGISIATPDWRALFLVNIPLTLIAVVSAWLSLRGKEFNRRYRRRSSFDYLGATLITLALIGLNIGLGGVSPEAAFSADSIEQLAGTGDTNLTIPMLSIAAISFLGFIVWESVARYPLIDLRLFRQWNYSISAFVNFCVGFTLAIGLVSIPLLINIRDADGSASSFQDAAFTVGLVLSGLTVPMALASVPGGWLSDRFGYRKVTMAGLALAAFGFVLCGMTWAGDTSYWLMAGEIAIVGVGLGLTFSPVSTALMNDSGKRDRGISAALLLIMRLVGMSVAISGLTAFALYRVDQRVIEYNEMANPPENVLFDATVDQVNELFLIGAGVTLLAMLAAIKLHGGKVNKTHESRQQSSRYGSKDKHSSQELPQVSYQEEHPPLTTVSARHQSHSSPITTK